MKCSGSNELCCTNAEEEDDVFETSAILSVISRCKNIFFTLKMTFINYEDFMAIRMRTVTNF